MNGLSCQSVMVEKEAHEEEEKASVVDGWDFLFFWTEKGYLYFERKGNQTSSPRPSFSTEVVLQVLGRHFSSPLSLQD